MKKKRWISALCAAMLLTACVAPASAADTFSGSSGGRSSSVLGSGGIQTETAAIGQTASVSVSSSEFALSLLQGIREPGKSSLISPASAEFALGMAANGAAGETLAQMEQVLGGDRDTLNSQYLGRRNSLEQSGVKVANSVWMNTSYGGIPQGNSIWDAYAGTLGQYYGAQLRAEDLGTEEGIGQINAWVRENTDGMIPEILDSPDGEMLLCLVNALAMDAQWLRPYTASDVTEGTFTNAAGEQQQAQYLNSTETFFEVDGASGIRKRYKDSALAFVAILPEGSLDEYMDGLTAEQLAQALNGESSELAQVSLPKFKVEQSSELNEVLASMGMADAFDQEKADLSAITGASNLYLSKVVQKTTLEVNEDGTKAAAATAIGINTTSMQIPPKEKIEFNRPFLFAVVDTQSGSPIFLGTVETL